MSRTEFQCSFIEYRGYKVVYRRYASLFFVVAVDGDDVASVMDDVAVDGDDVASAMDDVAVDGDDVASVIDDVAVDGDDVASVMDDVAVDGDDVASVMDDVAVDGDVIELPETSKPSKYPMLLPLNITIINITTITPKFLLI